MDTNSEAFRIFSQAHHYYHQGLFDRAVKQIRKYQKMVRYQDILHWDRRAGYPVSVSFIVVSYRAGKGLLTCLDSMGSQDDNDFEIIVVDNGGNDSVRSQLESYPILYLQPPLNLLPSEGRNVGAYFASGKYLVFIDDDALVNSGCVTSVKDAWRLFDFSAIRGKVLPKTDISDTCLSGHYDLGDYPIPAVLITEGNMAMRRDIFISLGGFDPLVYGGEGTELTYRCRNKFPRKDIYYWPNMVIYHDFVPGKKFIEKKQRNDQAAAYFQYLSPKINRLQKTYGRWYKVRPGQGVRYDKRNILQKLLAFVEEKKLEWKNRKRKPLPADSGERENRCPGTAADDKLIKYAACKKKEDTCSRKAIENLQSQLEEIQSSISFRLGHLLVETAAFPLKNFLYLPFTLAELIKDHRRREKRKRVFPGDTLHRQPGALLRNRKRYLQPNIEEHVFTLFPEFEPFRKIKNSSLKIACVISSRLYTFLDFEADIIFLNPRTWLDQIERQQPDMLLVEPALDLLEDQWKHQLFCDNCPGPILKDMLAHCRRKKLPAVFWDTGPATHAQVFAEVAALFDHVFAEDPESLDFYKSAVGSTRVTHLPPAIQPLLHNPVRHESFFAKKRDFSVLFDGWADILEMPERYRFLKELRKDGLHVVESRYRFVAGKLKQLPDFEANVMGHLAYSKLLSALRAYRVVLISEDSLSSRLSLGRKAMEAAACGASVVYKGDINPLLPEGVVEYAQTGSDAVASCRVHLKQWDLHAARNLAVRRNLFSGHTYAHRVQTICRALGLKSDWEEYPLVTVITPTKRPESITDAHFAFQSQTYPNKQWIIVINRSGGIPVRIKKMFEDDPRIQIIQVHEENNIGECMNLGIQRAAGAYWFKMDDDDAYGPNYILDMVLEMRTVDACISAKPTAFICLEAKDILLKKRNALELSCLYGGHKIPSMHICGATLAGNKTDYGVVQQFSTELRGCVDKEFVRSCIADGLPIYVGNPYNFAIIRKKDKSLHTWKISDDELVRDSDFIGKKSTLNEFVML